jgi:tetratricopeptide (TPR) repeat protein
MSEKTSRLYSIEPKDLPLKSEKGNYWQYGKRRGGWAVRANIRRAQKLYELFRGEPQQEDLFDSAREFYEREIQSQSQRLRTLGIIADMAGETELAIDLLRRTKDTHYLKYLDWRQRQGSPVDLAKSLDDSELDRVIGIFVRKKDFETADFLRKELRQRYETEANRLLTELKEEGVNDPSEIRWGDVQSLLHECVTLSSRLGDWGKAIEDIKRTPKRFDGERDYDLFDIIRYARIARKQDRASSDKLYNLVEKEASAGRRSPKAWAWIGMARAGKGDKKGALQAYEKAGCFTQARNLRKNLGLSTKPIERRIMEKEFYTAVLDSAGVDADFDPTEESSNSQDFSFLSLYHQQIDGLATTAKKFSLENFLVQLMRDAGMYFNLDYTCEKLGLKRARDTPVLDLMRDIENRIRELRRDREPAQNSQRGAFFLVEPFKDLLNQSARESASRMIEAGYIDHRQLLSLTSVSEDLLDYASLIWMNNVPFQDENWKDLCRIWSVRSPFIGKEGLETADSLFNSQNYLLLLSGFPQLLEEEDDRRLGEFKDSFREEIERQKQVKKLIELASRRLRRRLSALGMDLWDLSTGGNYLLEQRLKLP